MTVSAQSSFDRPGYIDNERPALIKLIPTGTATVLDVGCNHGGFGQALKMQRGCEVWGVEPDEESATAARLRLDHVVQDYFHEAVAVPDAYFDIVTFNDSLEHMADPAAALRTARSKLKPGGRIHCCVPNMRHIECMEHLLLQKDWRYEEVGIRDRTHLRFFTAKSIKRLFVELQFEVLDIVFINEEWWEPGRRLRSLLFKLFPDFFHDMRFRQLVVLAR